MALYDDSLETSVTSAKLHNSPYKVDFMRKLVTFSTGTFLLQEKFHGSSKACKKITLFIAVGNANWLSKTDFRRLIIKI